MLFGLLFLEIWKIPTQKEDEINKAKVQEVMISYLISLGIYL